MGWSAMARRLRTSGLAQVHVRIDAYPLRHSIGSEPHACGLVFLRLIDPAMADAVSSRSKLSPLRQCALVSSPDLVGCRPPCRGRTRAYIFDTIISIIKGFCGQISKRETGCQIRLPFGCQPPFRCAKFGCRQAWPSPPMLLISLRFSAARRCFQGLKKSFSAVVSGNADCGPTRGRGADPVSDVYSAHAALGIAGAGGRTDRDRR